MKQSYLNSERNSALSLKPLMTIRLLLMVLFVCFFGNINSASAATRTASVSGNWNATATWGGGAVPTSADDVIINSGITVTVNANAVVNNLTINSGGILTVGAFSITVSGATTVSGTLTQNSATGTKTYTGLVTINSGGIWNNSGNSAINFRGGLTNNGAFTAGTGIYTFSTSNQTLAGIIAIPSITVTTITLTNNGNLTVNTSLTGTGGLTQGATGFLNIGGTSTITTLTASAIGNTVNYTGVNQTIKATTYNNLSLSGSGTKIFSATTTVASNLSISSGVVASLGTSTTHSAGSISLGSVGTVSGSWGGSSSTATNKDATYFDNTAGKVNVTNCTSSLLASATIVASATTICSGTNVTFTATPTNGGTTPSYQWKVNGLNVGTNSSTYSSTTLANNDSVSCVLTSNIACSGTSNSIVIAVNPLPTILGTLSVCLGSTTTLSSTIAGGSWTSATTTIATVDSSTGVVTGVKAGTTIITYTVTSNGCTSSVSKTVTVSAAPTGIFVEFTQGAKDKTEVISTVNCGAVGGGSQNDVDIYYSGTYTPSGSATYQWQVSYDGMATWVNALGPTAITKQYVLDPAYTIYEKVAGDYNFRVIITDNGCSGISDYLTLSVSGGIANLTPGTIAGNQDFCGASGDPLVFSESVPATGGDTANNPYTYQWQYSTNNINFINCTGTGSTSKTFNPTSITQTTYYRRVVATGSCTAISNTIAVSIKAPAVTVIQTTCTTAGSITVITPSPAAGITYYLTGTNPVVATQSNNTGIFTNLAPGVYTVSDITSSCTSLNTTVTINGVPAMASVPSASATFQPTFFVSTGVITVSPIVSGYTYSIDGINYTNTTGVFYSVAPGTYNVTAMNGTGCYSLGGTTVTILDPVRTWNGSVSTNWNTAANWTPNGVPTANNGVVIPGGVLNNPIITGANYNAYANTITVLNSGILTVDSQSTITVTDFVNVQAGSSFIFNSTSSNIASNPISSSGSLVQINDSAVNTGDINYSRSVAAIHNTDFTYWSSPVSSETLATFSPNTPTDKFFTFNSTGDFWESEIPTNTMVEGTGYSVYGPQNVNNSTFNASFSGVPNNGPVAITGVLPNQSLLIGNPYPSAIDADLFISANAGVIDGSLYFWTHNTDPVNGQYLYSDYATYNLTGGTGTTKATKGAMAPSSPVSTNLFINANVPNGYIASGQGFFVSSNINSITDTKIVFNNSMRVSGGVLGGAANSQFFKTTGNTKAKMTSSIEKDRVWLNLSNDDGVFKQTLVGYITGATNDYETAYDADSYDSLDGADFYSINEDSNLVIQGRALPFDENDTVPLGFRSSSDGEYTINIDQVDGLLTNQSVYVEDKLTNTVTDLKNGDYKFSTVAGTFNDRFVLKFTNTSKSLSVKNEQVDGIMVFYSNNYNTLIIHNGVLDTTVKSVGLFNMAGQNISNWDVKDIDQTNIQIPIKEISSGIYIVKVKTTNGESNKKIIVN